LRPKLILLGGRSNFPRPACARPRLDAFLGKKLNSAAYKSILDGFEGVDPRPDPFGLDELDRIECDERLVGQLALRPTKEASCCPNLSRCDEHGANIPRFGAAAMKLVFSTIILTF